MVDINSLRARWILDKKYFCFIILPREYLLHEVLFFIQSNMKSYTYLRN